MPAILSENGKLLQILENFDGLPSLKKLQAHLNFDREDAVVSRAKWKPETSEFLVADPVITAAVGGGTRGLFGDEQTFKVLYCRLSSQTLFLTHERAVIGELLKAYPYALFVFSDNVQKRFHFVNVKDDGTAQKRRRISVGNGERLRTAAEQLGKLDGEQLAHLSLSQVQQVFDEVFDVGPVTREFYQEYETVFEFVESQIQGFPNSVGGREARRLFTQRLFNRLMFIAFIQKKGWLKYKGATDYLFALWQGHQSDKVGTRTTFYSDRVKTLFFLGLNTGASNVDIIGINRGGVLRDIIGDVPYLNGGLFEQDDSDRNDEIIVPDEALEGIITELFQRFNFTITESTPLDIEVAVDPEMLGKIFEELVTRRHESGSYYTPKPIVSYMCREALKGYLRTTLPSEPLMALARFVDRHEPDDLRDAEAVLNALRSTTVCDPACGSGAYLLGMLHELLDLRQCLFQNRQVDSPLVYDRKLDIIQRNIYGVDIDPFAVNIARLRLWLSLAVDFDGDRPEPLPNLDYKIEVGDSICSPSPGSLQMGMQQQLVEDLLRSKAEFLALRYGDKQTLRSHIETVREDIRVFSRRGRDRFDWVIDFAEVFVGGGFDIVLANPPYINALEFSRTFPAAYRQRINAEFESATGAYDFFIPFFERGVGLLKPSGQLAFITPNKYLAAKYAASLRSFILNNTHLRKVVDLSACEVFTTAMVYPVITFLEKNAPTEPYDVVTLRPQSDDGSDPSAFNEVRFDSNLLQLLPENIWGFLLSRNIELLLRLIGTSVMMGTLGQVNATATAGESETFTSLLYERPGRGRMRIVNTGTIDPLQSLWGIYPMTHSGRKMLTPYLDVEAPAVNERRREMYRSPKIIWAKMALESEVLYDAEGSYASFNTNCFFSPLDPLDLPFLAAYSSSRLFMFFYNQFFSALRMSKGYYQFQAPQLRVIPVPIVSEQTKRNLGALAAQLSDNVSDDAQRALLLREIDRSLYEACGITDEEAASIEA